METSGWFRESSKSASSIRASFTRSGWTEQSIQMMLQDPTGPHAFSPSLSLCCLSSFLFPSFFLIPPYFHFCFCFTFLIRSLSMWMVWSLLQKCIQEEEKKRRFCHLVILGSVQTNTSVFAELSGLTIHAALWGLAKEQFCVSATGFPHFIHFVTLKRQGKTREPKSCSAPPKTAMELRFENPCSCIWVSNSASSAGQRIQGCPLCINLCDSHSPIAHQLFLAAKRTQFR